MRCLAIVLLLSSLLIAKNVRMTSLEWPPYSGETLPEQGLSVLIAKKAFEAMGYTLEVEFYPWKRALMLARSSKEYHGYLPEYRTGALESACYFSHPIGKSVLGMVERKNKPLAWENLRDLARYKLGIVDGYVNTQALDGMIKEGVLDVETSTNDLLNIKKVLAKRIDTAVIDRDVLAYYLATDKTLAHQPNMLGFHSKILEEKSLHVCFQGQEMMHIFNQGLKKIDIKTITKEYFSSLGFPLP